MSVTKYNYIGEFQDIAGKDYKVELYHDSSCAWKNITLLETPVVIEWENSEDTLYKPVKMSGATIGVLTNGVSDYLFDLYSTNPKDCSVQISDASDNIVWTGWITPSLYSQGYESSSEELNIDCIDGLSTLKYYKYESIDQDRTVHSLLDIILHCLRQCECYKNLYFEKSVFLDQSDTSNILRKLHVHEAVFFDDEDKYDSDGNRITDDDKDYSEVLEIIMTYMGMTMVAEGDSVYILDYDHLRHVNRDPMALPGTVTGLYFWKIDISTGSETTVNLARTYRIPRGPNVMLQTGNPYIIGSSYAQNGQKLSLEKVYNKVSVKDNFNKVDSIFPDLWDNEYLEQFYPSTDPILSWFSGGYVWCNTPNVSESGSTDGIYKFLLNNQMKFWCYNTSGTEIDIVEKFNSEVYSGIQRNNILTGGTGMCCCICKAHTYDGDMYTPSDPSTSFWPTGNKEVISYFSWDNYLLFCIGKDRSYNTSSLSNLNNSYYKPMFETDLDSVNVIGTDNMYFVISGNFKYYDKGNQFGLVDKFKRKEDDWNPDNMWLCCKLYYQGQWWNGASWQNTECRFKLYGYRSEKSHYLYNDMNIKNNIPWQWQINKTGTAIKLPSNIISNESPKFTIYTPASPDGSYRIDQLWMKDFDISLVIKGQDDEELEDSDTIYTNLISENNIEELDQIDFDICTFDDKTISNNTVTVYDTSYGYLDTVYHPTLKNVLDSEYNNVARFEELLCCRIANQYNTPKVKLEVHLSEDYPLSEVIYDPILQKTFIIDSKEVDLRWRDIKYTLIEKI